MRKVQRILPQALDEDLVRLGLALNAMRRWEEVVGVSLAARSCPDRYDRGVLWVAVSGSAWAQELRLMKNKILPRLGEIAERPGLFTDIRFGVRKLPPRESATEVPAQQSTPEDETRVPPQDLSIQDIASRRLRKWRDRETD